MQHVIRRWKGIELSYPFLQKIFDKNHSFSLKLHLKISKNCTGTPWFQDVRLGNARFKIYVFPKNTACVGLKTPKAALTDVCLLLILSKTCLSRPKWPLFRRTTSIFRRIRQLSSRVFSPNLSSVPWENFELRMALRGAKKWSSAWFPSNARRTSQLLTKDECMSVKIYVYFVKVFYVLFVDRILDVCFRIFDSLLSVYSFVCR